MNLSDDEGEDESDPDRSWSESTSSYSTCSSENSVTSKRSRVLIPLEKVKRTIMDTPNVPLVKPDFHLGAPPAQTELKPGEEDPIYASLLEFADNLTSSVEDTSGVGDSLDIAKVLDPFEQLEREWLKDIEPEIVIKPPASFVNTESSLSDLGIDLEQNESSDEQPR